MNLSDIATDLETLAKAEWAKVVAEGTKIEQEIEPVLETDLALAAKQFGQLAVQTVLNLMTAAGAALSGGEKLNLTATTLVQAAATAGVTLAATDATTLANNAYTAVMGTAPAAGETVAQEVVGVAEKAVTDVVGQ